MKLDIHPAVVTATILSALGALAAIWWGITAIRAARRISFFRIRRQRVSVGWRLIFFAACLGAASLLLGFYGEPVIYRYFPPSPTLTRTPTMSLTPSISLTPTITETPTITLTPLLSYTPTASLTPFLPPEIITQFQSSVTPNPEAAFSPIYFSQHISSYQAVNPATVFQNPVGRLFASYSYNNMLNGSQWTMLWYRNGTLVHTETAPWSAGSGGYGYAFWNPSPDQWQPGTYQVLIFVGVEAKSVGQFIVEGEPPTLTPTRTATITLTPTLTPSVTSTPLPTLTLTPSNTRFPTATTGP